MKQIRKVTDDHDRDREYRDDFIHELDQMTVDLRAMLRKLDHVCTPSKLPPLYDYCGGGWWVPWAGFVPFPLQHVEGTRRCKKLGRSYVRRAARERGGVCGKSPVDSF